MDQIPDLGQLLQLAQSPAGQAFLKLLRQKGGKELEAAAQTAASGDYTQAKNAIAAFLSTPEAQKLLKQWEDANG